MTFSSEYVDVLRAEISDLRHALHGKDDTIIELRTRVREMDRELSDLKQRHRDSIPVGQVEKHIVIPVMEEADDGASQRR